MGPREACLRKEYGLWYPKLDAETWQRATAVARVVARQLLQGQPSWQMGPRLLSDDHFEFRGGLSTPGRGRTRLEDRADADLRHLSDPSRQPHDAG